MKLKHYKGTVVLMLVTTLSKFQFFVTLCFSFCNTDSLGMFYITHIYSGEKDKCSALVTRNIKITLLEHEILIMIKLLAEVKCFELLWPSCQFCVNSTFWLALPHGFRLCYKNVRSQWVQTYFINRCCRMSKNRQKIWNLPNNGKTCPW